MATILQTAFSNSFYSVNIVIFQISLKSVPNDLMNSKPAPDRRQNIIWTKMVVWSMDMYAPLGLRRILVNCLCRISFHTLSYRSVSARPVGQEHHAWKVRTWLDMQHSIFHDFVNHFDNIQPYLSIRKRYPTVIQILLKTNLTRPYSQCDCWKQLREYLQQILCLM